MLGRVRSTISSPEQCPKLNTLGDDVECRVPCCIPTSWFLGSGCTFPMWFDVHWSVLLFRLIVMFVLLVSRASLSWGDTWHFGTSIWEHSSFELGCFPYFALCFLMWKDVLCLWWRSACAMGECLCLYKYLLSSSSHFRLSKWLFLVVRETLFKGKQRDGCTVVFPQSISFITGMSSLLFPSFCICCVSFMVKCGWAVVVLIPSTIRLYSSVVLRAVCSRWLSVLVTHWQLFILLGNHHKEMTFSSSILFKTSDFKFSSL